MFLGRRGNSVISSCNVTFTRTACYLFQEETKGNSSTGCSPASQSHFQVMRTHWKTGASHGRRSSAAAEGGSCLEPCVPSRGMIPGLQGPVLCLGTAGWGEFSLREAGSSTSGRLGNALTPHWAPSTQSCSAPPPRPQGPLQGRRAQSWTGPVRVLSKPRTDVVLSIGCWTKPALRWMVSRSVLEAHVIPCSQCS